MTAVVQLGKLAATHGAFAPFACHDHGGDLVTWGHPEFGRGSSRVQEQMRNVQHIQSTAHGAFAAILESGAVVTGGDPESGGDSSRVQDQLRNVQHIQATDRAFAARVACVLG